MSQDDFALMIDTVGGDEFDPGFDRYFIGVPVRISSWEGRRITHPLQHFDGGGYVALAEASSLDDLKKKLRAMLKACDEKPRRLVQEPVKLRLEK